MGRRGRLGILAEWRSSAHTGMIGTKLRNILRGRRYPSQRRHALTRRVMPATDKECQFNELKPATTRCPECGNEQFEPARGRFGPIWRCTNRPACKFTLTSRPTGSACSYETAGRPCEPARIGTRTSWGLRENGPAAGGKSEHPASAGCLPLTVAAVARAGRGKTPRSRWGRKKNGRRPFVEPRERGSTIAPGFVSRPLRERLSRTRTTTC